LIKDGIFALLVLRVLKMTTTIGANLWSLTVAVAVRDLPLAVGVNKVSLSSVAGLFSFVVSVNSSSHGKLPSEFLISNPVVCSDSWLSPDAIIGCACWCRAWLRILIGLSLSGVPLGTVVCETTVLLDDPSRYELVLGVLATEIVGLTVDRS